jgi:hypothetical protein
MLLRPVPFWGWLMGRSDPPPERTRRAGWLSWWSRWWRRRRRRKRTLAEANRRDAIRYNINLETSCLLIAALEGDPMPVRVRNISAGGVSLVLHRGIDPETLLNVQLLNRPRMFFCKIDVKITYIVEHPSGDWIVGGSFTRRLTDDELRSLLAKD